MNKAASSTQQKAAGAAPRFGALRHRSPEAGVGQEVARWFFHVRGTAGTLTKTISAYDTRVMSEPSIFMARRKCVCCVRRH